MVWIHLAFKLSNFNFKDIITTIYRQGTLLSVNTMEEKEKIHYLKLEDETKAWWLTPVMENSEMT